MAIREEHTTELAGRMPRVAKAALVVVALAAGAASGGSGAEKRAVTEDTSVAPVAEGQRVFRFDAFGDERFRTAALRLHEVVEKLDPTTALELGLK